MSIGLGVNIWTEEIKLVIGWALPGFHCSQVSDRWWDRVASAGCHEALNQEPGKRITVRAGDGCDPLQQMVMRKVKRAQVRSRKM